MNPVNSMMSKGFALYKILNKADRYLSLFLKYSKPFTTNLINLENNCHYPWWTAHKEVR